ncbi:alpha-lytic protease prodomain-containing protein [Natronosporangium hydrolyticum]|uniref:Alpha-lytic protease prodomain-containing protein n=1 Tax=Natronosporangium hydrolyticum TaxID=2811111 RepID=A0A895YKB7_9ACTN|nr:S1 family peptidase [Natronosporangium hydrolyticum]QSB15763.1 alpha-lytic protease prodomain-containing protein [Natronosporangium hydrolyticum]
MALSAGIAAALAPAGASASPGLGAAAPDDAPLGDATMLAAMERDLGLSNDAALERLALDFAATETEVELRDSLESIGGAWIDGDHLVVAVTDQAEATTVRAAGAVPRLVTHTEAQLDSVMTTLDGVTTPDASEVYGWHVDVVTNQVVVQAAPGADAVAEAWVEEAGVDAATVRVETTSEAPELLYDIIGGQAYYPGNSRCSVGFAVQPRGFVTAGHCGGVGTSVRGHNQVAMGTVQRSNFPGSDAGYVAANTNWVPRPWVTQYNGSNWVVRSSQVAAIGAATCRSGSTTGAHCGNITHRNQTVNYAQGSVSGLTRTTVCAEPGDSGGSFVASGISAQGVTSGGSGNCSWGGVTFFQPINPMLSSYGLTLVTG